MDRGLKKLAKDCLHCNKMFSWRKKWERSWPDVKYCSDACKRAVKEAENPKSNRTKANADLDPVISGLTPRDKQSEKVIDSAKAVISTIVYP